MMLKLTKRVSAFVGAVAIGLGGLFVVATPAVAVPLDTGVQHRHAEPLSDTDDDEATTGPLESEPVAPVATETTEAEATTEPTDAPVESTPPAEETTEPTEPTETTAPTDDPGETDATTPPTSTDNPTEDASDPALTLGQGTYTPEQSASGVTWSVGGLSEGDSYYLYVNGNNVGGSDVMDNVPDADGNASGVIGFQELLTDGTPFFVEVATGVAAPAGEYTLELRVEDAAGEPVGSATATFVVTEEAPPTPFDPSVWVRHATVSQSESVNGVAYGGDGWLDAGMIDGMVTLPDGSTVTLRPVEPVAGGHFDDTLIYYAVDEATGEAGEQLPFPAGTYTITVSQAGVDRSVSFEIIDEGLSGNGDWENPGPIAGDGPNAPQGTTESSDAVDTADSLASTGTNQAALIGMLAGAGVLIAAGAVFLFMRRFRSTDS
jgi:LPXTG-motif cell wall-anchored protein